MSAESTGPPFPLDPFVCSICGCLLSRTVTKGNRRDGFLITTTSLESHPAHPINGGRCCSACNWRHVLPARLGGLP